METEIEARPRGRHRMGGKHSDPVGMAVAAIRKPRGAHAVRTFDISDFVDLKDDVGVSTKPIATIIPDKPRRAPKISRVTDVEPGKQFKRAGARVAAGDVVAGPLMGVTTEYIPRDTDTGPTNVIPLKRNRNRGRRTKYQSAAIIATGGLLLVTGTHTMPGSQGIRRADATSTSQVPAVTGAVVGNADGEEHDVITVPLDAILTQEKVLVKTEPAPVIVEPAPVVVEVAAPAPKVVEKPAQVIIPAAPAPAPVAPPAPVASGKGSAIAAAALGQLNVSQDCTMLATNSLRAVGIKFHGWPWEYATLGTNVGVANAQPGDLLLYSAQGGLPAHIAVYVGNGQAVHGGWDGWTTKLWSTFVGHNPSYGPYAAIRV